jgi:hypothetical protein
MQHIIVIVRATCLELETKRIAELRQWETEMQKTRNGGGGGLFEREFVQPGLDHMRGNKRERLFADC